VFEASRKFIPRGFELLYRGVYKKTRIQVNYHSLFDKQKYSALLLRLIKNFSVMWDAVMDAQSASGKKRDLNKTRMNKNYNFVYH